MPSRPLHITVIGDYSPSVRAHPAISAALAAAGMQLDLPITFTWTPTDAIPDEAHLAAQSHAIWLVPGSPYRDMNAALRAIRIAREKCIPFLGICGGLQHAVVEFARNVMGIASADHEETAPDAPQLFISRLACSLFGKTDTVSTTPGSRLHSIWPVENIQQQYFCSFAINPNYQDSLDRAGLRVCATDSSGHARAVELPTHPFFIATQFQPELNPTGELHPLIPAFLRAAAQHAAR